MAQADIARPVAVQERPTSQRGQSDLFVAWALIATHTMQHVYSRGFLVLLPFMMETLGIGYIAAGVMEAVRRISSGVASMGGGVITDRVQHLRGPILAGSIGLMGFGYLLIGVFPNYYVIIISLGFAAAAGSIWHPPALGILSQRFPERRGFYISLQPLRRQRRRDHRPRRLRPLARHHRLAGDPVGRLPARIRRGRLHHGLSAQHRRRQAGRRPGR